MATKSLPQESRAGVVSWKELCGISGFEFQPGKNYDFTEPPTFEEIYEENYKSWLKMADQALLYYKDVQGAGFELVGIKGCEASLCFMYNIYHLVFEAKPKYGVDRSPQLFFAELYEFYEKFDEYVVKICLICDPSSPDVMKGCTLCGENMVHPRNVKLFAGPPEEACRFHTDGASGVAEAFPGGGGDDDGDDDLGFKDLVVVH
ncbi:hypothetical protein OROHE_016070 [Orobanche hederae]